MPGEGRRFVRGHRPTHSTARDPIRQPSEAEIAWAAGLFEGEGFFTGRRRNPRNPSEARARAIQISQKDPWVLERVRDLFGGSVLGPYYYIDRKNPTSKRGGIYRWNAAAARAANFLTLIYPLLSPRRQSQAQVLFADVLVVAAAESWEQTSVSG